MSNFKTFADAVNKKFMELSKENELFLVNVPRETLWETYQNSFPSGTNEIFRERRMHECNTCYSFIKRLGPVVAIKEDKLDTIWNIPNLEEPYATVAAEMHKLISNENVVSVFRTDERLAGKEYNIEANVAGDIRWDHFYADINNYFITNEVASTVGEIGSTVSVFKRALEEFTESDLEVVLDLCGSIYKGEEFAPTVRNFLKAVQEYSKAKDKNLFAWKNYKNYPARIRNSAIGTLIVDISEGKDLEDAVKSYEAKVAPENYKRTTAVVTPRMRAEAIKKIDELGIRDSLPRRHATLEDISVNNVLFANHSAQSHMKDELEDLIPVAKNNKPTTKETEITIDKFLSDILPNSQNIEAYVENKHTSNLVSLVAPVNPEAPNILKWDNNFSWSYNGEVTDSMKERVKEAGGKIDGILRCSIQWNEEMLDKNNDLDLHCKAPNGHIYYSNMCGILDVDIRRPNNKIAVENMIWTNNTKIQNGTYNFYVHNFSGSNKKGFRAQIEFDGQLFEYDYPSSVKKDVPIATVTLKNGEFTIKHHLPETNSSKNIWDTDTMEWQTVSTIMLSPNYWDGQKIGNKHFFFMLENCKNPDDIRGFYNEFLSEELRDHRKVFETLSANMKCEPTDNQLSGLGFSSTQRNELHVKVDKVPYLIKF